MKSIVMLLFIVAFGILCSNDAGAQRFESSLFFGTAFAQIRGDGMGGHNKPGITGGFKILYPTGDRTKLSLGFGYVQKGSRRRYDANGYYVGSWHLLRANYVETPITLQYELNDQFSFDAGLSWARLVGSYFTYFQGGTDIGQTMLRKNDYSYHLGGYYTFSDNMRFFFRHSMSFLSVDNSRFTTVFSRPSIGLINIVAMVGLEFKLGK